MRRNAGKSVVRIKIDEQKYCQGRPPLPAERKTRSRLGEAFRDSGFTQAFSHPHQSAVPDENVPSSAFAENVGPIQNPAYQEHTDAKQRRN